MDNYQYLSENTKKLIHSHSKTSYQIWNTLNKSFTKSPEQRRVDLKDLIDSMKYNIEEDIHIFISILLNYIDELEIIDGDLSPNTKIGILNRSLPDNLRWINVFQFKNNWEGCVEYVKNIIPEIIFSNTKKSTKSKNVHLFNVNHKDLIHNNQKLNNRFHFSNKPKSRYNKSNKCNLCHKYGHTNRNCWHNSKNKFENPCRSNLPWHRKLNNPRNKKISTISYQI